MTDGPVLRLFAFRPVELGSVFDSALRDVVLPEFTTLPGLLDAFVGRQGPDETGDRLIVSVWESQTSMTVALNGATTDHGFQLELAAQVRDPSIRTFPIEVSIISPDETRATILRVFRGQVREGELREYADEVRAGTLEDVAKGSGPLALYLGLDEPDRFVTVSAWADWDAVSAATGSNIRQPIRTKNSRRLVSWTATHYEVLPDAAGRPVRPALVD